MLGNGTGSFAPALNYTAGTKPTSVAVDDFNGDGKSDLAVADYSRGTSRSCSGMEMGRSPRL